LKTSFAALYYYQNEVVHPEMVIQQISDNTIYGKWKAKEMEVAIILLFQ